MGKRITTECPQGHSLTVSSRQAGSQIPCPKCQVLVLVPEATTDLDGTPKEPMQVSLAFSEPEAKRLRVVNIGLSLQVAKILDTLILWGIVLFCIGYLVATA